MKTFYITTPIYYVNGIPHIGHAYTTVSADVIARYHRLLGQKVFLATGTDENATKIVEAAQAQGKQPLEFLETLLPYWYQAWEALHIHYDDFIRTTEPRHVGAVQEFFRRLKAKGDIYLGVYEGWYCVFDETYFRDSEVGPEGLCPNPECRRPLRRMQEEAYFFRLTKYERPLLDYIEKHPDFLQPDFRRNEVIAFIKQGLRDTCISRPASGWGIPVPEDPKQVIYVWFDALINYLTVAGWPEDSKRFAELWPADLHLMSKDIFTRFHATIWPAMLMAMDLPLPRLIFAHGYWTIGGEKMSKSKGIFVSPLELTQQLARDSGCDVEVAADALRYYFLREVPFGRDGEFSLEGLYGRFNSDLANDLGNLLNRTLSLCHRYNSGVVPEPQSDGEPLRGRWRQVVEEYQSAMERLQLSEALQALWEGLSSANRVLNEKAPWTLYRESRASEAGDVLYSVLEALRIGLILLYPVMPVATQRMWEQLGLEGSLEEQRIDQARSWGVLQPGHPLPKGQPVFPRIEKIALHYPPSTGDVERGTQEGEKLLIKEETEEMISISDFQKIELRTAKVEQAEPIPGADKLLRLEVTLNGERRQLVAGVAPYYQPQDLVGKTIVVVANLAPAKIRGVESQGMLLAADGPNGPVLLVPDREVPPGVKVR